MEEKKSKFCTKDNSCAESGLSKRILKSNGCTKHESCSNFFEKDNKIQEKIQRIEASCTNKKCHKDPNVKKVNTSCLGCRNFSISDGSNLINVFETLSRCLDEYCGFGKNCIDASCMNCERLRLYDDVKGRWVEFRGGKDIKGNNF